MRKLEQQDYLTQDITSALNAHVYTADRERLVFVRVFVAGVAGSGDYTAYITVQRSGAGSEFHIVPLTITPVDSGVTSICLSSVAIPVDADDVVRTYIKGLVLDTDVDITVEMWEDDSNFYTTAPGFYPSGTLGYALGRIGTSPTITVQVPTMDNSKIELVRGDDYTSDHGTAIRFASEQWPDLTGATVEFISQQLTAEAVVSGTREVLLDLTSAETELLSGGLATLVATFPDTHVVTLIPRLKIGILDRIETVV